MNKRKDIMKIIRSSFIFLLLTIATFFLIFKNLDMKNFYNHLSNAENKFIFLAFLCILIYIGCESINLKRVTEALGYKVTYIQALKYGSVGFFFSGITPFASGGQPLQIYYMAKDKISVSHGSLGLLVEVMCFQLVSIFIAIIGFIYNHSYIVNIGSGLNIIIPIGIIINAIVLVIISLAIISPSISYKFEGAIKKILIKFHKKSKITTLSLKMNEYRTSSKYIKTHSSLIIKMILTTFLQLLSIYSITYLVYLSLGCNGSSWFQIISLQAVISVGVSAVPLPGSVGISEGAFKLLFIAFFGKSLILSALVLSRGIGFYFAMVITGLFLLCLFLKNKIQESHISKK